MAQIVVTFCHSVGLLGSVRLVVWYGKGRVPVACSCCWWWPDSPAAHYRGCHCRWHKLQAAEPAAARAGRHLVLAASSTAKMLCRLP